MTEHADVIVIGAGHNGLTCAAYLARSGRKVVCLEAADSVGGMSAPFTMGDYRFPGLAHLAAPVSDSIRKDLGLEQHGYRPGPAMDTVALDADGDHLILGPTTVTGNNLPAKDQSAYAAFRDRYCEYAGAIRPLLESRPPRLKDMDFADTKTLARLGWKLRLGLGRDKMYEFLRVAAINIYDVLNEAFDDERLKGAIALDAVQGNAMGPRSPGTVLTWLKRLHDELDGPVSLHACDGTDLISALQKSAEAAGAEVRTGSRVENILVENGATSGIVLTGGTTIRANTVVSNVDPRATLGDLVGATQLDAMFANRVSQIRGAGVVAKLFLALRDRPEFAGLDNASVANRLVVAPTMRYVEHAFNHSKYGEYSEHPALEIVVPSLQDESLAPPGHHVMSVNVAFVPYALEGGWEARKAPFAERVIAHIAQFCSNLESIIVASELLTPADIESRYGAVHGHWHHGEMTIHQSFMMRPLHGAAQYDTPVDGLFLCGAGCHPGGGLTGLPGRNAAQRVLEIGGLA